jgi:hypothetical protein
MNDNKTYNAQGNRSNPSDKPSQRNDQVGKDTDGDGRVVQPGHKPGEVDGDKQRQKKNQDR